MHETPCPGAGRRAPGAPPLDRERLLPGTPAHPSPLAWAHSREAAGPDEACVCVGGGAAAFKREACSVSVCTYEKRASSRLRTDKSVIEENPVGGREREREFILF